MAGHTSRLREGAGPDADDSAETPWHLQARFDGFEATELWQAVMWSRGSADYRVNLFGGSTGYFPSTALLAVVGLDGYTLDGSDDPFSIEFGFYLKGEPSISTLPASTTFGFWLERVSPLPLVEAPLVEAHHPGRLPGYAAEIVEINATQREVRLKLSHPADIELSPFSTSPRTPHLMLLVAHAASKRAAVIPSIKPRTSDVKSGEFFLTGLLPGWDVPPADLRLHVVLQQPNARVALFDVEP